MRKKAKHDMGATTMDNIPRVQKAVPKTTDAVFDAREKVEDMTKKGSNALAPLFKPLFSFPDPVDNEIYFVLGYN